MIALDRSATTDGFLSRAQRSLGAGRVTDLGALAALLLAGLTLAIGVPLPVALLAIACAGVAAVIAPAAATAAALASVPLVLQPVSVGESRFSLLELAIVLGTIGLAAQVALEVVRSRSLTVVSRLLRPLPTLALPIVLIAAATLSLFTVADPRHIGESLREYRLVILEPVAIIALARWTLRRGGERLLITAFVAAAVVAALVGAVQVLTGYGTIEADAARRATGPYSHPNHLALYLERVGLLLGGMALVEAEKRRRLAPVLIAIGAGLASTVSRGGFLAAVAGGATIIWLARSKGAWRWLMVSTVVAVAAFGMLAEQRLLATGSDGSASTRELLWSASIRMIRDHPIFGVGLDQFLYQYRPRYVDPAGWAERYTSHPHNLVLDFWLRLGLAGLVVLAAMIGALGWALARIRRQAVAAGGVAVGAAAALVGGVVHGLVDNSFFLPDLAVMTWFFVALLEFHLSRQGQDAAGDRVAQPVPERTGAA